MKKRKREERVDFSLKELNEKRGEMENEKK